MRKLTWAEAAVLSPATAATAINDANVRDIADMIESSLIRSLAPLDETTLATKPPRATGRCRGGRHGRTPYGKRDDGCPLDASALLAVTVILAKALRQNTSSFRNAHMRVTVILAKAPYQGKLLILM
jgi:hypothetical protein